MFDSLTRLLKAGRGRSRSPDGVDRRTSESGGLVSDSRADGGTTSVPPEAAEEAGDYRSDERMDAVVESILDGLALPIFTVDAGGYITAINREGLDLFRKTREDLIGVCLFDLDEADNSVMERVLGTGEPVQNLEDTIVVGDGVEIPVMRSVMPIYSPEGDIVGALEINRDISERVELKRRETLLEEYQAAALAELRESIAALSEGDFTVEPRVPEPERSFDAIDAAHDEFAEMAGDLRFAAAETRDALAGARERADRLATVSREIRRAAADAADAIGEITASSRDVTEGAELQTEQAEQAEENVSSLSAAIEEITASTQQIDAISDRAADRATEGTEAARAAIDDLERARDASQRNIEVITSLEAEMDAITEMATLTSDISDQINLLALNANIEAARAGDAGSGFKVVADEVKRLAEESKEAVEEITDTIDRLQGGIAETSETIEQSNDQVAAGVDAVREVVDGIEEIEGAIDETSDGVAEIGRATADQAEDTSEVHRVVEDVAERSDDISARMQEVSASVDQQSAAVEEVADAAENVDEMSDRMNETLARFKLDVGERARLDEDR